jgi:ribosomal biogenesis protein LAS1
MSVPSAASITNVSQRRRKRIRIQTRPTPWKDSWELDAVGRSLLLAKSLLSAEGHMSPTLLDNASLAELKHALHTVSMWKARSEHGRIPHSMDTTFVLAQAAWRDAQSSSAVADALSAPSSVELRMSYATAILRGVNGLADALQQNRAYAASVASLCEQMGLPTWLVDVRHEAAHNDLPSLPVLRLATKTFLGYLEERYWVPLANARWEAREAAVQLLVKYKAASKNDGVAVVTDCKKENIEADDSIESSSEESQVDDSFGIWGESMGTNHNRFAALFQTTSSSETTKPKKKRKKDTSKKEKQPEPKKEVVSALHFARQVVRDVPIDIGHQVALSFLVWGGIGDAPTGRGVLIPGSAATFPACEDGAQKIRQRYKPLLFILCKAWPGFTHALLVHLCDHVVSIEASAAEEQLDAGSERKLYFLTSWIRFLLSKEFHVHCDKSIAFHGKNDLSKKAASNWTKYERDFMESPTSYSVLCQAGLPLNSLCDRFANASEPGHRRHSHGLAVMFNGILGVGRVPNVGASAADDSHARGGTASSDAPPTNKLSLADMELVLSDGASQDSAKEKEQTSDSEAMNVSTNVKTVWTKCQAWDECAIGSLPGHPV